MPTQLHNTRRAAAYLPVMFRTVCENGGKTGLFLRNEVPLRTGNVWKTQYALPSSRVQIRQSTTQEHRSNTFSSTFPTSFSATKPSASATSESDATSNTAVKGDARVVSRDKSQLTLLYDGECPLCMREVRMLLRRSDERGGTLTFVDIAQDDFDETKYGVNYETAMGRIHAVRQDGEVISGVRVFREAYEAVDLGWVYTLTKFPPILWFVEGIYNLWAARRLQMTGRDTLDAIILARNSKRSCR